jgi:hypothetical protein
MVIELVDLRAVKKVSYWVAMMVFLMVVWKVEKMVASTVVSMVASQVVSMVELSGSWLAGKKVVLL